MATDDLGELSPTASDFSNAPTANSSTPSTSTCRIHDACWNYIEDDPRDATHDLKQPCHGWPKLVDVMVEHPGFESFQAFRDLNIKSLLYYQAELVQLREDLHALEWEDHRRGGKSAMSSSSIRSLLLTANRNEEGAQDQLKKMKKIREVLKEYNDALLQYAKINELPEAETFNVKSLRKWVEEHIESSLNIKGPGSDSWGKIGRQDPPKSLWNQFGVLLLSIFRQEKPEEEPLDLVVPGKRQNIDSLTRWVAGRATPFWHNLSGAFIETKTYKAVAPIFYILCIPFRHTSNKAKDEEKQPGGILCGIYSKPSIPSPRKRWSIFHRKKPAEQKKGDNIATLSTYSMSAMIRFTKFVATIIACLLPIVGIAVLSKLHGQAKILGFIGLFTAIFAIGIMILTDSDTSRSEIFTATAAFAAVLVVFVQNQNPGSGG